MELKLDPANISILHITEERLQAVKPVTVLDIFQSGTNFHDDGLFSTLIFGRVGTEERDSKFSYIDVKVRVFHPFIYKNLCKLKNLYKGIMAGREYAVWDEKIKDFVKADQLTGQTGYHFFFSHWEKIKFKRNASHIRDSEIDLIEKYKAIATTSKIMVIPAGLRDIELDELGRHKQSEINDFYRKLLNISNAIPAGGIVEDPIVNNSRHSIQLAFNELYDYILNIIEGKKGFIQSKWGRRKVQNGTRDVLSAADCSTSVLGGPRTVSINHTIAGLYQVVKGTLPIIQHELLSGFLSEVFSLGENRARLVNPQSLRLEEVELSSQSIDRWFTGEGLEKVINNLGEAHNRNRYIKIEGYYLGLVYKGPNGDFKLFNDLDTVPSELGDIRKYIHPITYGELFYITGFKRWKETPAYVTRYPVTGGQSIYPSWLYVRTTAKSELRYELNHMWERTGEIAAEYPDTKQVKWIDTMSPHPSRLAGLGGDLKKSGRSESCVPLSL